jgi:ubiquitin-like modifier-activating enzyme ATG7
MIPDLDVDTLQNSTKVLLLGAGTLGCSVSRTLLGWGIRNFKFVDYGNVSYSNPVRQILFNLKDCHYGNSQGKPKAQAAADALKQIAPDVISEGIQLSIPMPGHAYDEKITSTLNETVQQLDQLIQDSDVIFLLTDTRESRWLPTVMAAVHDKILINAALGLDSWLVMRHGCGDNDVNDQQNQHQQENKQGSSATTTTTSTPPPSPSSNRLGCYFCNDVVAPENSTRNRTLDQQCTVTRPGLAPIASSMAVELFVSLLHHPQRQRAPAPPVQKNNSSSNCATYSPTDNSSSSSSSPLGVIPHQIRGSIVTYTMMTPSVPAFVYCTGCSSAILDEYRKDKFELVSRTCSSIDGSSYLENLSGLTQFRAEAAEKIAEMENDYWDDDDDGDDDDIEF